MESYRSKVLFPLTSFFISSSPLVSSLCSVTNVSFTGKTNDTDYQTQILSLGISISVVLERVLGLLNLDSSIRVLASILIERD